MKVEEHVPFSILTTFKVGGTVRYLVEAGGEEDLQKAVAFAKEKGLPLIPLGGGSNMLGRDGELDAVLIKLSEGTIGASGGLVTAHAGYSWDRTVSFCVERGLWGIENLSGIPGTVGGAIVQNIGAYGAVLSDVLESVEAFDTHSLRHVTFSGRECCSGYRTSIFKQHTDRFIVLSARLSLSKTPKPKLDYKDLAAACSGRAPTLAEIRDRVIAIRRQKFPPLQEFGTAGSFFLNPVVPEEVAAEIQKKYPGMPVFQMPEGGVKVPIGWHFEHILNLRGFREGRVEAWRAQALVIVAHSGATADEVRTFAQKISERARRELGITLAPEVRFL